MLVGLDVADEDQGVVILNLLHGRLSREGVLDDVVSIHLVPLGCGLARILRLPVKKKSSQAAIFFFLIYVYKKYLNNSTRIIFLRT